MSWKRQDWDSDEVRREREGKINNFFPSFYK